MMNDNRHLHSSGRDTTTAENPSDVREFSPSATVARNGDLVSNANLSDGDVTEVKQVAQMGYTTRLLLQQEPQIESADQKRPDPDDLWRELAAARLAAQPNLKPLPPGKKYHVYFCFAEEDLAWVRGHVDVLEKEHGFRCCFSERDFNRGATVTHNSNEAIERSAKVVFVVTTASMRNAWCSFEAEVVTHWGVDSKERLLILVVLEETKLPPTLHSFTKIDAMDPTFIDKIITAISDDGLSQIEDMDLLGGQPPTTKAPCPDVPFSLDGLETELDGIQKIMKSLDHSEIKDIAEIAFGHGAIADLPESSVLLFRRLKDSQKLQSRDVIYLQTLLWKVKRADLFQKVADEAKRLYRNIGHKMCHLDFPHLKPVPGFNALKFHVAVDMENLSAQRLEKLKADVIKAVDIPMESQEYIRVVGIEQGSVWVTITLPQEYAEQLRTTFCQPCIQAALARAQITGVKFSPFEEEMFVQQECAETKIPKTDSLPNTPLESEKSDPHEKENEIRRFSSQDASAVETSKVASMRETSSERTEETSASAQPEPDHSDPGVNWEAELEAARSPHWITPPLPQGKDFHVNIFSSDMDLRWAIKMRYILMEKFGFSCYWNAVDSLPGSLIADSIIDSLRQSCTVVFLVSQSCREDDWYRFAVKVAKTMASRGVELKIIPVMVKRCNLPKAFQSFGCIDATIPNFLCKVIKTISKSIDLKKTASSQVQWSIERTTASQKKPLKRETRVGGGGKDIPWYRRFLNRLSAWLPFSQGASMSNTSPERTEERSASARPEADHSEPRINWEAELEAARSPHWITPPLPQGKDFHVYISCAEEDIAWAIHLTHILETEFGFKCCLPIRDGVMFAPYSPWIFEFILQSCTVAALVSPFYLQNWSCSSESEAAVALSVAPDGPRVIPVMLKRCTLDKAFWLFPYIDATVPYFLRELIDAISSDDDDEDEFAETETSCKDRLPDTTGPQSKKKTLTQVLINFLRRAEEKDYATKIPDIGRILKTQAVLFAHTLMNFPDAQLKKDIKEQPGTPQTITPASPWRQHFVQGAAMVWDEETERRLQAACLRDALRLGRDKPLNIAVLGERGCGKTAFISSLCAALRGVSWDSSFSEGDMVVHVHEVFTIGPAPCLRFLEDQSSLEDEEAYGHHIASLFDLFPERDRKTVRKAKLCREKRGVTEQPHLVVYVLDSSSVNPSRVLKRKIDIVTMLASRNEIGLAVVLTKADHLSGAEAPHLRHEIVQDIFHSQDVCKAVQQASMVTGLPVNRIFPVINNTNRETHWTKLNILHLCTLARLLGYAELEVERQMLEKSEAVESEPSMRRGNKDEGSVKENSALYSSEETASHV